MKICIKCGQILNDLFPHACPNEPRPGIPISDKDRAAAIPPLLLGSAAGLWIYHNTHDGESAAIAGVVGVVFGFTRIGILAVKLALWGVLLFCLFYLFKK